MKPLPTVSIVMPVRNERQEIEKAVEAALSQDYDGPLEVVVADGASTDGTREYLDELAAGSSRVRVVDNPDRSAAAGLNRAIEAATGDIIARCDGHSRFEPSYIRIAVETLGETEAANVGGRQDAHGDGFVQRAIAIAMTSPLGVGNSKFHYSTVAGPTDTVFLGVFRRDALESVGGFDESLARNQDYELNHRLISSGRTVWFDPRLRVSYRPRASLRALWRQYADYGTWKRVMLRRTPDALKLRQLAPPLLVIGLLLSVILAAIGVGVAAAIIPGLYVAFLVLGTLWSLARRRNIAALGLLIALPVMHLAWGYGFLFRRARL